jgi:predicted DNA-binding transcriptional regulator AlpA
MYQATNQNTFSGSVSEAPLLGTKAVSDKLGVSERSLLRMVKKGLFPEGIRVGRCWKWQSETVGQWIATQASAGKAGAA